MPHITTCPQCGKCYEAREEEDANNPQRLCVDCWSNGVADTAFRLRAVLESLRAGKGVEIEG